MDEVKTSPEVSFPELSLEEKLAARDLQIELVSVKETGDAQIQQVTKQVQDATQAAQKSLIDFVRNLMVKHNVPETTNFNFKTLKFF